MANYKAQLKHISTFVFDYDGVLTDGSVIMMPDGEALRISNIKDGYALQLAVKKGYNVAIISGANSASMSERMNSANRFSNQSGSSLEAGKYNSTSCGPRCP